MKEINSLHVYSQELIDLKHEQLREEGAKLLQQIEFLKSQELNPSSYEIHEIFHVLLRDFNKHMQREEDLLFSYCSHSALYQHKIAIIKDCFFLQAEHSLCLGQIKLLTSLTHNYEAQVQDSPGFYSWLKMLKKYISEIKMLIQAEEQLIYKKIFQG